MIYGHVNALEYKAAYDPKILKAIEYCRSTDVSSMKEGRYPLEGDDFIVLINERRTAPWQEKLPEVHREYAELQFIAKGHEYMGFYPDRGDNEVLKDCLEEKDTLYYKENGKSGEVMLPMYEGFYAVFFPEDVHRPFCQMEDGPQEIKKIVIKIKLSTLKHFQEENTK